MYVWFLIYLKSKWSSIILTSCPIIIFYFIQEVCTLTIAFEFGGDKWGPINFIGLVVCMIGISIYVVSKAMRGNGLFFLYFSSIVFQSVMISFLVICWHILIISCLIHHMIAKEIYKQFCSFLGFQQKQWEKNLQEKLSYFVLIL